MTEEEKKFLAFGRMVWGMMTDCIVAGGTSYARRKVTFPTNAERTVKGSMDLIVTTDAKVADLFEKVIAGEFAVSDMEAAKSVQ